MSALDQVKQSSPPGVPAARAFLRCAISAALLAPFAVLGQSHAGHDMKAMPATTAEAPADAASAPSVKKDGAAGMDHSGMKGMNHGDMKRMDHGGMKGMDHGGMKRMDHGGMKGMDHGGMKGMDHGAMKSMDQGGMKGMDHGAMKGMDMGSMQGGEAPPDARDPNAYSDGLTSGPMPGMDMADDEPFAYLLLDQLEYFNGKDEKGLALDAQAWFGGDRNKLWLKASGERSDGRLGATRTEALWNRAIAPYWGLQLGIRHDFGGGPGRNWAAFGVQGLAPYWFELEATAYVGESGRTALRFEAEYELLLTQRLILQPEVEVNLYGRNDPQRGIGSGLSDVDLGLRLRYEFTRKFAPYIGVVWTRKFGNTADYARAAGDDVSDTQFVAGVRIWF